MFELKYWCMGNRATFYLAIAGIIATFMVAIYSTSGYTGYAPDLASWLPALIIPAFMTLFASAYYSDQRAYEDS